jgi:hypothetical protein
MITISGQGIKRNNFIMKKKEIYLQKEILALLRNHGGRMEEELVCQLLGITREEIPWGYKIGWGRCHHLGGNFHLILSGYDEDDDEIVLK